MAPGLMGVEECCVTGLIKSRVNRDQSWGCPWEAMGASKERRRSGWTEALTAHDTLLCFMFSMESFYPLGVVRQSSASHLSHNSSFVHVLNLFFFSSIKYRDEQSRGRPLLLGFGVNAGCYRLKTPSNQPLSVWLLRLAGLTDSHQSFVCFN